MKERARNIAVGLTALVGLVGLLAMMLLFGYAPEWLEPGYRVTIELPHAAGLSEGSRVRLSGLDIGSIETVKLREPSGSGVIAIARIREEIKLPAHAQVSVATPLLGGGPTIEVQVGEAGLNGEYLPRDGSAVVQGEAASLARSLTGDLRSMLEQPLHQFEQLSAEWKIVGENLNQLLEPRDVDQVDLEEATGNLATIVARADKRLAEMQKTLQGINEYVNDEQLREDIRVAAANARDLTGKITERVDEVGQAVNENLDALRSRYVALADDMSKMLSSIQQVADKANNGDGTVGRMVNDPALYNNLNDAVHRMKAAIDEMRLLVEKWKAEGVPVQL